MVWLRMDTATPCCPLPTTTGNAPPRSQVTTHIPHLSEEQLHEVVHRGRRPVGHHQVVGVAGHAVAPQDALGHQPPHRQRAARLAAASTRKVGSRCKGRG